MLTAKMHVWPAPCAEGPPKLYRAPALSLSASLPSACTALHPLPPTAHRPPPTVHQPAASSLSLSSPSPAAPSAHHSGVASTAAQRSAPHLTASPSTAPPGPSPRPALTPRPSLPSSARRGRHPSGQSRFVSDKAAAVDAESHGQLPASAARPKTPGSSPAPPRWVLAELG